MEWHRINANNVSGEELISRIYGLFQGNNNDKEQSNLKMGQGLRHFCKEDIQRSNKHIKRCSTF